MCHVTTGGSDERGIGAGWDSVLESLSEASGEPPHDATMRDGIDRHSHERAEMTGAEREHRLLDENGQSRATPQVSNSDLGDPGPANMHALPTM